MGLSDPQAMLQSPTSPAAESSRLRDGVEVASGMLGTLSTLGRCKNGAQSKECVHPPKKPIRWHHRTWRFVTIEAGCHEPAQLTQRKRRSVMLVRALRVAEHDCP